MFQTLLWCSNRSARRLYRLQWMPGGLSGRSISRLRLWIDLFWQSCPLRAARDRSGLALAIDTAAESSAGTQPYRIQETTRGIGGCNEGTASKAAGHQSMLMFPCSGLAPRFCHY